eukprot:6170701-Amphidinium_carterae.2
MNCAVVVRTQPNKRWTRSGSHPFNSRTLQGRSLGVELNAARRSMHPGISPSPLFASKLRRIEQASDLCLDQRPCG